MFSNIGSKIKGLAVVICVLGIIASVTGGIYLMSLHEELILSGALTIVGGSLGSWISVFVLYGFGELIENSQLNYETTYKIYKELHKKDAVSSKHEPIRPSATAQQYYDAPPQVHYQAPPQYIPVQQPVAPPQYVQQPAVPTQPAAPVQPVEPAYMAPPPSFDTASIEPAPQNIPAEPVAPVAPAEPMAPHQPTYRPDVVRDGNLVVCPSCGSKNIYGNDTCWRCSFKLME